MTQQSALPTAQDAKRRLAVPDYINIGVFSALYFVIVALCALVSNIIFGVAGNLLLPAFAALLAGPVFMLFNARVRAFGAITTMGVVLGLFLFVSGHFATSLITGIAFPLLGDLVARLGAYRNKTALLGGYVLFSFGCVGPILPIWLMKGAYIASLERKGKDSAYIASLFDHVNTATFAGAMFAIVIGALAGGVFGLALLRRHFAKAGVTQ